MKLTLLSVLLFASASVYGQANGGINATRPVQGTVFYAGNTEAITWQINPAVTTISEIQLLTGDQTNLQVLATVGTSVDPSTGSYNWNVPGNTAANGAAVLVLKTNLGSSYSGYFNILPADPSSKSTSSTNGQSTSGTNAPNQSKINPSASGTPGSSKSSSAAVSFKAGLTGAISAIGMVAFFF